MHTANTLRLGILILLAAPATTFPGPALPPPTSAAPLAQEMVWVRSQALREVGYDFSRGALLLGFANGTSYLYPGVPAEHYLHLKAAARPGEYFHRHIRPHFPATRLAPAPSATARSRRSRPAPQTAMQAASPCNPRPD